MGPQGLGVTNQGDACRHGGVLLLSCSVSSQNTWQPGFIGFGRRRLSPHHPFTSPPQTCSGRLLVERLCDAEGGESDELSNGWSEGGR
jgi:hypothetical protein